MKCIYFWLNSSFPEWFFFLVSYFFLLRFWGFGKLSFFINLRFFFKYGLFLYCVNIAVNINSSEFLHLSLRLLHSVQCCSATFYRFSACSVLHILLALTLFSPLSTSLFTSSNCSCDNQTILWIICTWSHNLCSPTWNNPFSFQNACNLCLYPLKPGWLW